MKIRIDSGFPRWRPTCPPMPSGKISENKMIVRIVASYYYCAEGVGRREGLRYIREEKRKVLAFPAGEPINRRATVQAGKLKSQINSSYPQDIARKFLIRT
jgi:hypothetical protein